MKKFKLMTCSCFALLSLLVFYTNAMNVNSPPLDSTLEQNSGASQQQKIININQASEQELVLLTGIGEQLAKAIVKYRQDHGKFNKVEDLSKVKGIGKHILDKNKHRLMI